MKDDMSTEASVRFLQADNDLGVQALIALSAAMCSAVN